MTARNDKFPVFYTVLRDMVLKQRAEFPCPICLDLTFHDLHQTALLIFQLLTKCHNGIGFRHKSHQGFVAHVNGTLTQGNHTAVSGIAAHGVDRCYHRHTGSGCFLRCAGVAHLGKLIDLYSYPVRTAMRFLLEDKTTGENIIWATNTYERYGDGYRQDNQITPELISGVYANLIQPRILKAEEEQAARTKSKAEVFTPSWVVCYMNNKCDDDWFGRENVFNTLNGEHWEPTKEPVYFEKERDWQRYVDSRRLEITCGEAPYLVSRYDAATGEGLPIESRIGILDRKLRVVNENTDNETDWLKWTRRAFESTYGYEYQGDNLLVARINLLMTFVDYMQERWRREPTAKELNRIANVISWNIWQMDGLKGTIPGKELYISDDYEQLSLFASDFEQETLFDEAAKQNKKYECKIRDWRAMRTITYNKMKGEK